MNFGWKMIFVLALVCSFASLSQMPVKAQIAQDSSRQLYKTVPDDLPELTVLVPANGVDEGYIFLASLGSGSKQYLLIVDNDGQLIYYQKLPDNVSAYDFKKQPANGSLTYVSRLGSPEIGTVEAVMMDNSYATINSFSAVGGSMDVHDFQLLPNGHVVYLMHSSRQVDMSSIVEGGRRDARVIDLVIQETDQNQNLVFEWNSKDHFDIRDMGDSIDLTKNRISYCHGNSIDVDLDGNFIVSCRRSSEIIKIDRQTGNVLWRMGGSNNEFTLVGDTAFFYKQHDARRLPNGNLTVFDNRKFPEYGASRVVEYAIDEEQKTASLVWQYTPPLDLYAKCCGNAQRLPNGNTLINWGSEERTTLSEIKPDGSIAFELDMSPGHSYRAFRFPWQGKPADPAKLLVDTEGDQVNLYFSWNGATNIAEYQIFADTTSPPLTHVGTQTKTGFEEMFMITNAHPGINYFRVMPIDSDGHQTRYSNEVSLDVPVFSIDDVAQIEGDGDETTLSFSVTITGPVVVPPKWWTGRKSLVH